MAKKKMAGIVIPPTPAKRATRASRLSSETVAVQPAIQPAVPPSASTSVDKTMNVNIDAAHYSTPQPTESSAHPESPARTNASRLSQGAPGNEVDVDVLGAGVKELISAMSDLESLGLANLKIPLAKCVVCGDQSAGKSSVIEAISGIKVPRAGGTCTRCPMFIKLESHVDPTSTWKAKVSLRLMYSFSSTSTLTSAMRKEMGRSARYFPWVERSSLEEVDFTTTTDVNHLGLLIKRAQLAIINPSIDSHRYIPGADNEIETDEHQTEFSPNVICISISAPGLPNLSFYDLPGVIGSRGDRQKALLKRFIEGLVREYISDTNALVLLTSTLEVDWAVASNAAELVAKTNATSRCVGVLTKPDRINDASRYIEAGEALDGSRNPLGHGYFVVKQPDQKALDREITHQEARDMEEDFFGREPWSSSSALSHHRGRFGTLNLQKALSDKLAALSSNAIPQIWDEINTQLASINTELAQIPAPPIHNVIGLVFERLQVFTSLVSREMERDGVNNSWKLTWDRVRVSFAEGLQSLKPRLKLEGTQDRLSLSGTGRDPATAIDLSSDEDDEPQPARTPVTPKKRKLEDTSFEATPKSDPHTPRKPRADDRAVRYDLDEMRSKLREMTSAVLDNHVDPKGLATLSMQSLQHWDSVLKSYYRNLEQAMVERLETVLVDAMREWTTTLLYEETRQIVGSFVAEQFIIQLETVGPDALKAERNRPYMSDARYFDFHKARYLNEYKHARFQKRQQIYFAELEEKTGREVSARDQETQAKKEPLKSLLGKEPYERELDAIANIRAYYELAAIRFNEVICMRIESQLFRPIGELLRGQLQARLQLLGDGNTVQNRCVELLAEDSEREERRRELEDQKARLIAGQDRLIALKERFRHAAPSMETNEALDSQYADDDEEMSD
jgi:GTPase SAR1 family protein